MTEADDRWLRMPHQNPEPQWPPPHGESRWWDIKDDSVGTADFVSEYFWHVRIRLQVKIEDGVIIDALCLAEDRDDDGRDGSVAEAIVDFLCGKTLAEALRFQDPIMWAPSMAVDTLKLALRNWALKRAPARFKQLPALPPEPEPARDPLWRRTLRRIPFFQGFGL